MSTPNPNDLFDGDLHVNEKQCTSCGQWKQLTKKNFETRRSSVEGKACNLRSQCNDCRSKERKAIAKARKSENPPKDDQPCPICKSTVPLVLDHDHKTGKFRGWICDSCNKMLGMAKDNPDILIAGAKYLSESKKQDCENLPSNT